jgi:hypothetical protein
LPVSLKCFIVFPHVLLINYKQGTNRFSDLIIGDFGEALRPFLSKNAYLGRYVFKILNFLVGHRPPPRTICLINFHFFYRSYGIVAAYAFADTMDRGFKAYWQRQAFPVPKSKASATARPTIAAHRHHPLKIMAAAPAPKAEQKKLLTPVSATVVDSLLWHGAASLALPFVVINRQVKK